MGNGYLAKAITGLTNAPYPAIDPFFRGYGFTENELLPRLNLPIEILYGTAT